jgi:hypothetical protein
MILPYEKCKKISYTQVRGTTDKMLLFVGRRKKRKRRGGGLLIWGDLYSIDP